MSPYAEYTIYSDIVSQILEKYEWP